MRRRRGGFGRKRFGDRGEQRPLDGVPDGDREREAFGPACEQPGRGLRDEVERRRVVADRPRDRAAERAVGVAIDEEPCRAVDHHRATRRRRVREVVDRTAQVFGDERPQLDREQLAPPVLHGLGHGSTLPSVAM